PKTPKPLTHAIQIKMKSEKLRRNIFNTTEKQVPHDLRISRNYSRKNVIHTDYLDGSGSITREVLPEMKFSGKTPAAFLKRQFSSDILEAKKKRSLATI
ncbi:MAG: hypothetical protein ACKO96_17250, partial [Flammeovirgaceae bacterium]